ncbi:MAG TPA: thioredoxin family protein [Chthoniobacterales bacterium]|nr:thioredoxin family protein [Chthoniobacterales bacterium]
MKYFRLALSSATALLVSVLALSNANAKPDWLTDFKQAQDEARTKKRLLLVDFTGSDWCGWCIKLEREVFSKPEFKEYASKNLVLMEVDFPRAKTQSPAEKKQNYELQERFGVQGFPTIVVLDSEGKKLAELGYDAGLPDDAREMKATPEAFIATLEKLRKG